MIITDCILKALISDWNSDPVGILEGYEIDCEDWTREAIKSKSDELLNQYKVIDDKVLGTDLEKSYQECQLIFEYEGQMYGVKYIYSPYYNPELITEPYKVKQIIHTITVTEYERCD